MEKKKNNKKKYLALLLALFVCVGGTMAWLTSTSQLTNNFAIGQVTPIDPDQNGPGPDDTDIDDGGGTKLNGNLYEPSWVSGTKIYPDATIDKDPYVGIGPNSEASYAYVYVKNNMKNVYFKLEEGWEAVAAIEYNSTDPEYEVPDAYVGGLFKWSYVLGEKEAQHSNNIWTTNPLFKTVTANKNASFKDLSNVETPTNETVYNGIEVIAFVHQAYDSKGVDLKTTADSAAKETFKIN